jgi:hypothetical protein
MDEAELKRTINEDPHPRFEILQWMFDTGLFSDETMLFFLNRTNLHT